VRAGGCVGGGGGRGKKEKKRRKERVILPQLSLSDPKRSRVGVTRRGGKKRGREEGGKGGKCFLSHPLLKPNQENEEEEEEKKGEKGFGETAFERIDDACVE